MKLAPYWKAVVAVLTAVVITLATVLEDNVIDTAEWLTIAAAFLGAIGVYVVKNAPLEE